MMTVHKLSVGIDGGYSYLTRHGVADAFVGYSGEKCRTDKRLLTGCCGADDGPGVAGPLRTDRQLAVLAGIPDVDDSRN